MLKAVLSGRLLCSCLRQPACCIALLCAAACGSAAYATPANHMPELTRAIVVPEVQQRAARALQAFGYEVGRFDRVAASSGTFAVMRNGPVFLKVIQNIDGKDAWTEPYWTKWAADAGFAPEFLGYHEESGVLMSRFVQATPIPTDSFMRDILRARVLRLLRRVHTTPMQHDSASLPDAAAPSRSSLAGLQADPTWQGQLDLSALARLLEHVESRLRRTKVKAAIRYGDTHFGNVLWEPEQGRVWLIDWEGAGVGDPLMDLARFAFTMKLPVSRLPAMVREYHGLPEDAPLTPALEQELAHLQLCVTLIDIDYLGYYQRNGHTQGIGMMAQRLRDDAAAVKFGSL